MAEKRTAQILQIGDGGMSFNGIRQVFIAIQKHGGVYSFFMHPKNGLTLVVTPLMAQHSGPVIEVGTMEISEIEWELLNKAHEGEPRTWDELWTQQLERVIGNAKGKAEATPVIPDDAIGILHSLLVRAERAYPL